MCIRDRNGATSEISALTASTSPASNEGFGKSVSVSALSNGIVYTLVGADLEELPGNRSSSGAAFLFRTYNDITIESATLQSADDPTNYNSTNAKFGNSVHITSDDSENNLYITAGEWGSDYGTYNNQYIGAVNVLKYSSGFEETAAVTQDTSLARADYTRDGTAKRSLNISNIRTNTGSISVGNYDHNIQVIQTTGKTQNPRHIAENSEVYQQFAERRGNEYSTFNKYGLFSEPIEEGIQRSFNDTDHWTNGNSDLTLNPPSNTYIDDDTGNSIVRAGTFRWTVGGPQNNPGFNFTTSTTVSPARRNTSTEWFKGVTTIEMTVGHYSGSHGGPRADSSVELSDNLYVLIS